MVDDLPTHTPPIVKAGDKVSCPRCKKPLYTVMTNLYRGQQIKAEYFNPERYIPSVVENTRAICPTCVKLEEEIKLEDICWCLNGAIHTTEGWKPYNPYGSGF